MPEVLNRIEVRRLCWRFPPVDALALDKIPCKYRRMFGVVVLQTCRRLNRNRSVIPSKMQIGVRPFLEMPAHTCTFSRCYMHAVSNSMRIAGIGLGLGAWPSLWQQNLLCDSIWIVDSSVHITSSKLSSWYCRTYCNRFTLFSSWIIWQYTLPLNVHPSVVRQQSTVRSEIELHFLL